MQTYSDIGFVPEVDPGCIYTICKQTTLECKLNIDVFFLCSLDLPMEYNPSDHPRASTIFLSKSQTDGEFYSICTFIFNKTHL